ncbi:MAG: radical SAM protein [Lysobacteraceae bacterium]
MNYGLLSIATRIEAMGIRAIQVQGDFNSPSETMLACVGLGIDKTDWPIFVSVPSFYALSWARSFIDEFKMVFPGREIVVGGRWVVGDFPKNLDSHLGGVDLVVVGTAEEKLASIISTCSKVRPEKFLVDEMRSSPFQLDYRLLHARSSYQPSIEVSRGCGMGCSFCQEKDERLTPLKPAKNVLEEMEAAVIRDDFGMMTPYLEASVFTPNRKWASAFRDGYVERSLAVQWRGEARVDSVSPDVLEILSEAGLKVIDLGLESASLEQLSRMRKTLNPKVYLKRASALLRKAHSLGVRAKVNVLLFAGEGAGSISETMDWLEQHRDCVSGVSVGPVMVFGWDEAIGDYIKEMESYGASISSSSKLTGVRSMNLSSEIDYEESLSISANISRSFMTATQYFELKSFSYFERGYHYDDFCRDVRGDPDSYGFRPDDRVEGYV